MLEAAILLAVTPFLLLMGGTLLSFGLAALLLALWLVQQLLNGQPLLPATPLRLPIVILLAAVLVGVLVSADRALSIPKALALFVSLGWFRLLTTLSTSQRWLWISTLITIIIGLGLTLFGALTANWALNKVAAIEPLVALLPTFPTLIPAVQEGGTHPNVIGGTILFFVFLPLSALFAQRKQPLWQLLAIVALLLATFILLLTQSRSAWFGYACGCGLLLLLYSFVLPDGSPRPTIRLVTALSALAAGSLLGFLAATGRLAEIVDQPQLDTALGSLSTINFRLEMWEWGLVAAQDFLFTGIGFGSFGQAVYRLYPLDIPISYDFGHAHNQFLQVQLDVGIVGLVAYVATVGLAVWMGWHVARHGSHGRRHLAIGAVCSMVALHIFGMTDAIALGTTPSLLWWCLLALIVSLFRLQNTP